MSLLDDKGRPGITQRALIVPPGSQLGPLPEPERARLIAASQLAGVYVLAPDRQHRAPDWAAEASHLASALPGRPVT